jgi:hypothetical protein
VKCRAGCSSPFSLWEVEDELEGPNAGYGPPLLYTVSTRPENVIELRVSDFMEHDSCYYNSTVRIEEFSAGQERRTCMVGVRDMAHVLFEPVLSLNLTAGLLWKIDIGIAIRLDYLSIPRPAPLQTAAAKDEYIIANLKPRG